MSLTVKIWCPADEPEPEGLFNKASCPDAPPNWFREHPEVAAELYALERQGELTKAMSRIHGVPKRSHVEFDITVLDTEGQLHKFKAKLRYELTAHIERAE